MAERFLMLRPSNTGRLYVRVLRGAPGDVGWTPNRALALRFADRASAHLVQRQLVARGGIEVAVVPDLD